MLKALKNRKLYDPEKDPELFSVKNKIKDAARFDLRMGQKVNDDYADGYIMPEGTPEHYVGKVYCDEFVEEARSFKSDAGTELKRRIFLNLERQMNPRQQMRHY